ncbi:ArsR/SmtB family transcription factor [Actinoplanes regularis]|uniref:Helix-turn-helix domain-containing protein n=1 Tax=Actinoplanes regularis TaxID=52697 RepID=A0A239H6X8_9ACTN|nr:helix-turn-helix domain-containing protein [Actinoplanes regularis]SNS77169.1 Helix-turn-helix domain-containing protein [Actinoplanes regularis]
MSLGEAARGDQAALRALAHPVRLRILSLLTGASLTAAEVARELGLTHANASYHLRNLLSSELIQTAGEERIRGGLAKRYRYDPASRSSPFTPEQTRSFYPAAADELARRAAEGHRPGGVGVMGDAEVWVDPAIWQSVRDRIAAALHDLHAAARPPGTSGTIRTSTTVALFEMEPGFHGPSRPSGFHNSAPMDRGPR